MRTMKQTKSYYKHASILVKTRDGNGQEEPQQQSPRTKGVPTLVKNLVSHALPKDGFSRRIVG